MLAAFLRVEHQLTRLAMAIAIVMLVISVTLSFYQVLTRFVFNAPSTWTEVASRASMIWCVFMAAAATFRGGYMMAVEAIYKVIPTRFALWLETAIVLCCLLVLGVLIYFGFLMTGRVGNQTMSGMNISMSYAYAAIPTGSAFAIVAVLARLFSQLSGREPVGPDNSEVSPEVELQEIQHTQQDVADDGRGGPRP
ncbi:TRAP transporter small permease [Halomonas sp. ML-15]|uniref:TRAP transporter small permease n=1 Tax=Halomonas sp. ML-15 TaxID=2773305 RepID=UPI0017467D01|nr:TRAP transporter small permease [Halomonas sp. ML-15]MBD3897816.1 TRAP transporter small permease [Halomonas sp. ML-15]